MYMITTATKEVRIPPVWLSEEDMDKVIRDRTCQTFEGEFNQDKTITILVGKVEKVGNGRIVCGDGAVCQKVTFDQLVFKLKEGEMIEGEVVSVIEIGAFVKFGPVDGLVHVSQIMDEHVDIDLENQRIVGKDSGRTLTRGDVVRARIVALSINERNIKDSRIGLTMRQPGLGKLDWIEEDHKKAKKGDA